jgi:hypothetical protein
MFNTRFILLIVLSLTLLYSCTTVKPYQRSYLNDENMKPGKSSTEQFAESAHAYREGASGGGSGKNSGGCGCN